MQYYIYDPYDLYDLGYSILTEEPPWSNDHKRLIFKAPARVAAPAKVFEGLRLPRIRDAPILNYPRIF